MINHPIIEHRGGIIPFGSTSPHVLYQNALTDSASIAADGWTIKTNTLVDSSGVSLTSTTNGGLTKTDLFTSAEADALRYRGQVSITVPTEYIAEVDTGFSGNGGYERGGLGSNEWFVSWDDNTSSYGGIQVGTNNTILAYVHGSDSPQNTAYIHTIDKGTECVVTLSWNNGKVDVFIDGKPIKRFVSTVGTHKNSVTNLFKYVRIGSRFGSGQWLTKGSVKNLIFCSQPVEYNINHGLRKGITFFGHSFVDGASAAAGFAYRANERVYYCDATGIQNIQREFHKKGFTASAFNSVGLGGGYVSDSATTKLSTITAAAKLTDPDWFVCMMGTNDSLLSTSITNFESELDARINELMTDTSNMVLHTMPTLKRNTSYDTAAHVTKLAEINASIRGAPKRWEVAKSAGQGKIFIADSFSSFGGETPLANYFKGDFSDVSVHNLDLHPSALGYDQMARDAAEVILSNLFT